MWENLLWHAIIKSNLNGEQALTISVLFFETVRMNMKTRTSARHICQMVIFHWMLIWVTKNVKLLSTWLNLPDSNHSG